MFDAKETIPKRFNGHFFSSHLVSSHQSQRYLPCGPHSWERSKDPEGVARVKRLISLDKALLGPYFLGGLALGGYP